jgi:xanthine/CO dehydrogenase XdhC/CoxF family maturation factor
MDAEAGAIEAFVEFLAPPTALVVCGAGRDAAPLIRMAEFLGWSASVADRRHKFQDAAAFGDADLIVCDSDLLPDRIAVDEYTAVLVMTHDYAHDLALLRQLMPSRAGYIGLLGSRRRADRLCADLRDEGTPITPQDWKRLHAPAGLDIGSETPEEIALSIVSEIQTVLRKRGAGHLRGLTE